ncbi:iron-sulfur binding hydrogenase [Marispirochaeta sp.]|jgi:hypothetical protein|uniref:iron-sulfur binding hydrogenase n=1 Tax=Marispirochaeta sp. TaxID=2038653 RepID=UPI0029C749C5|nr:iron-sulfur binding hydrogenase [Marispirochaeta sp.]
MKITQLQDALGYTAVFLPDPGAQITGGYTSDLLSDVMANAPDGGVLVTIQAHKNTIAVCGLAGLRAVVLCNGREPDEGMREAAESDGVAIFSTSKSQFQVSAEISALL